MLGLKSGKVSKTVSENSFFWPPDMPSHVNNGLEQVDFAQQLSLIVLMIISYSESSHCSRKLMALVITSFLIVLNDAPPPVKTIDQIMSLLCLSYIIRERFDIMLGTILFKLLVLTTKIRCICHGSELLDRNIF